MTIMQVKFDLNLQYRVRWNRRFLFSPGESLWLIVAIVSASWSKIFLNRRKDWEENNNEDSHSWRQINTSIWYIWCRIGTMTGEVLLGDQAVLNSDFCQSTTTLMDCYFLSPRFVSDELICEACKTKTTFQTINGFYL